MANYREIFKSTGLLGSVQVIYVALAVVRNKVTALLIGAAGMGFADLYTRLLDLVGNATNFGLQVSAVKQLSATYGEELDAHSVTHLSQPTERLIEQVRFVRTLIFTTALLGTLLCLLISPLVSWLMMGDFGHTLHFFLLAPAVGFTTAAGGEMAILKATRRLRRLALASVLTAIATLIMTTITYLSLGQRGIIPVLVMAAMLLFIFAYSQTAKGFPYRIGLNVRALIKRSAPLLRLGMAYIASGILTSSVELLIRTDMKWSQTGTIAIGLYAAGYTLTVSYGRLLFVSMDGDFFPRLSAVVNDLRQRNVAINRQVNLLSLLATPFILLFSLCLPFIIRLIYTPEFLPIIPMVRIAMLSIFFKAIYIPVAYIPLANGNGRIFLRLEMICDLLLGACIIVGFRVGGLTGAGIGLGLAHLLHVVCYLWLYRRFYQFRLTKGCVRRSLFNLLILALGIGSNFHPDLWVQISGTTLALLLAILVSRPIWLRIQQQRKRAK